MKNERDHPQVINKMFPINHQLYAKMRQSKLVLDGQVIHWCTMSAMTQVSSMGGSHDARTTGFLMYALSRFYGSGEPYWRLDKDLAEGLVRTDPPLDVLEELPKAPFEGMYIEIPAGVFTVFNKDSGIHDAVGIYLAKDLNYEKGISSESLCIVAAGESKGEIEVDGHKLADDALVYGRWLSRDDVMGSRFHHIDAAWRIVANLLIALQNRLVELHVDDPLAGKKAKKVKRLVRQGARKVTVLSLRGSTKRRGQGSASGRSPKAHLRRGHWRNQWVREPGDRKVYETKKRENRPDLYKVLLWIHPTTVGEGDVERKVTRVRR